MAQVDKLRRKRAAGFWITYNDVWLIDGLNPYAFTVYSYLLQMATKFDAVFPSRERIAKDCWMSTASVKRSISLLKDVGLLETEKRPGEVNTYWVNDPDLSKH